MMNETTTALEARLASEVEALRGEVARLRACIAEVRRNGELRAELSAARA